MTARAGSLIVGCENVYYGARGNARAGILATFPGNTVVASVTYKNEGYYAAGSAWETWVTSGDPTTPPPSGHTLTQIQHLVLQ